MARLAPVVVWWQGVSRVEEGRAIARRRPGATVLVQVDVAGLPGRGGCPPDRVAELVGALRQEDLDVAGLMAVGRPGPPEQARPGFALVSPLADSLELPVRSMGMSDDFEVAAGRGLDHGPPGPCPVRRPAPPPVTTATGARGPSTRQVKPRTTLSARRKRWLLRS